MALHQEEASHMQAEKHPKGQLPWMCCRHVYLAKTDSNVYRITQEHSYWGVYFNPGLFKFAPIGSWTQNLTGRGVLILAVSLEIDVSYEN